MKLSETFVLPKDNKNLYNLITNSGFGIWSNSTIQTIGNNLISNSDFNSGDTLWIKNSGWTIVDQGGGDYQAVATAATGWNSIYQSVTTEIGRIYEVTYTCTAYTTGEHSVYVGGTITPDYSTYAYTHSLATGTFSIRFKATSTSHNIGVTATSSFTGRIGSITCYLVTVGIISTTSNACDTWKKNTGAQIYREHKGTNTKDGSFYSLKYYTGTAGHEVSWPKYPADLSHVAKFAGKQVTFGCWMKSDQTANNKLKLWIGEISNYYAYYSGSGNWEWVELTRVISSNTTSISFGFWDDDAGKTAYISQPMLVFGDYIGEGNYRSIANEVIALETATLASSVSSGNFSTFSSTTFDPEIQFKLRISNNYKALNFNLSFWDSGSSWTANTYFELVCGNTSLRCSTGSLNANYSRESYSWLHMSPNTTNQIGVSASGAKTASCYVKLIGVILD